MSKKMLINATHPEENRVAIVDDGLLTELDIEMAGRELTKGNIYKAAVVRVEPGLQAAFVDYGAERLGFLQAGEIHPEFYPQKAEEKKSRPRINEILHRGQELLVQIVKEERGTKGAALTTYLSLAGRYMVLVPGSHLRGISRKIEAAEERRKIKGVMNSLHLPDNVGYIVRTAAMGQTEEELKRDLTYLVRLHENIMARTKQVQAPALIYKESNLVLRSIRDYFTSDMDEVLIDDEKVYQEARLFFQQVMPEYAHLVKLHQERRPIFSRYQIEEQIETITKNKVPLASGGSIVIDTTEALVAIDVNSGKMSSEQGVEATAFKTNIEAAHESARQLRLRDLGGLVVIDFIDMRDRKHIREVEKALKNAMHNDKARVSVGRISQFGLLEMSRQRIKAALAEGAYNPCPHCSGSGRVKSIEAQAVAFFRRLQAASAKGKVTHIEGEVPLDVADYLLNEKRSELVELEQRQNVTITVKGRDDFIDGQIELEASKRESSKSDENALIPLTASPEDITAAQEEQKTESRSSSRRSRRSRRQRKDESTPSEQEGHVEEKSVETKEPSSPAKQENEKSENQRSRRRGRRRKPSSAQTTGAATENDQQQSSAGSEPEKLSAADKEKPGSDPEAKKDRETADQKAAAPTTETPTSEGGEQQTKDAGTAKKPTARRPRRSAAKKPETAPGEAGVAETGMDEQKKDAEPEKKPAARRPRRSAAKKSETAPAGAAETGKDEQKKDTEPEKKPAARRPRRSTAKKSETTPAEAGAAETGKDEQKKDAEPEKKPAARKPRRSTAKKSETAPAEAGAAETGKDEQKKDAAKKKTTERRRTTKTESKTTDGPTEST